MAQGKSIKSTAAQAAQAALPWRKGVAWWLVLGEGLVLLALGLYIALDPAKTGNWMGEFLAVVLGLRGLIELIGGLRTSETGPAMRWTLIHGTVGLVVGLLIFILLFAGALSVEAGRVILASGCLAFGLLGAALLTLAHKSGLRGRGMVLNFFFVLIGIILLVSGFGVDLYRLSVMTLAGLMLAGGVYLIYWAYRLFRQQQQSGPNYE